MPNGFPSTTVAVQHAINALISRVFTPVLHWPSIRSGVIAIESNRRKGFPLALLISSLALVASASSVRAQNDSSPSLIQGEAVIESPAVLAADNAAPALDEFLREIRAIQAVQGQFRQAQYDAAGRALGETTGVFRLLRPAYFLWEIQAPDQQLVVATPEYLWHHDIDLETVTRRPVSDSGDMAPLQILGGDEASLSDRFSVSRQADGRFLLRPKQPDSGFEQVALSLQQGVLKDMEIVDSLQQRLVVSFTDVATKADLRPADFEFVPPPEADMFFYDE